MTAEIPPLIHFNIVREKKQILSLIYLLRKKKIVLGLLMISCCPSLLKTVNKVRVRWRKGKKKLKKHQRADLSYLPAINSPFSFLIESDQKKGPLYFPVSHPLPLFPLVYTKVTYATLYLVQRMLFVVSSFSFPFLFRPPTTINKPFFFSFCCASLSVPLSDNHSRAAFFS